MNAYLCLFCPKLKEVYIDGPYLQVSLYFLLAEWQTRSNT